MTKNVKTILLVCETGIRTQNFSSQNNYICCSRIVSFWQCDQMVRLFLIIWLLTTAQTCPKFVKIANVGLKFCQKQNKQSKVCLRFWKFVQVAKFRQIWSQCCNLYSVFSVWNCIGFNMLKSFFFLGIGILVVCCLCVRETDKTDKENSKINLLLLLMHMRTLIFMIYPCVACAALALCI